MESFITYGSGLLLRSEALPRVLLWHANLLIDGVSDVEMLPRDSEVIYAYHDGKVIGSIVFLDNLDDLTRWIYLSYVLPEYRQRGIFRNLWNRQIEHAKRSNIKKITGGTHIDNLSMQSVMEKLGRKKTYILYDYIIKE